MQRLSRWQTPRARLLVSQQISSDQTGLSPARTWVEVRGVNALHSKLRSTNITLSVMPFCAFCWLQRNEPQHLFIAGLSQQCFTSVTKYDLVQLTADSTVRCSIYSSRRRTLCSQCDGLSCASSRFRPSDALRFQDGFCTAIAALLQFDTVLSLLRGDRNVDP